MTELKGPGLEKSLQYITPILDTTRAQILTKPVIFHYPL